MRESVGANTRPLGRYLNTTNSRFDADGGRNRIWVALGGTVQRVKRLTNGRLYNIPLSQQLEEVLP